MIDRPTAVDPEFAAFVVALLPEFRHRRYGYAHGVDLYESETLTGWNLFVERDDVTLYYDAGGGGLLEYYECGYPPVPDHVAALLKRVQDALLVLA